MATLAQRDRAVVRLWERANKLSGGREDRFTRAARRAAKIANQMPEASGPWPFRGCQGREACRDIGDMLHSVNYNE
ncbi:hypothetical protein LCGC14_1102460 [marine sediment metagenome]|uniref:Uncharacterized protein n=1 Tax=marine sediment metagenome TaxID=412755 RepID=A0A0F9M919_9ZZZZ